MQQNFKRSKEGQYDVRFRSDSQTHGTCSITLPLLHSHTLLISSLVRLPHPFVTRPNAWIGIRLRTLTFHPKLSYMNKKRRRKKTRQKVCSSVKNGEVFVTLSLKKQWCYKDVNTVYCARVNATLILVYSQKGLPSSGVTNTSVLLRMTNMFFPQILIVLCNKHLSIPRCLCRLVERQQVRRLFNGVND